MSFELFIAKRIYSDKGEGGKRYSRPAVRIAMAGIAVGLMVMIVSLAVVMGFKREVTRKITGFGSHVQLVSLTQTQDYVVLPVHTTDSLRNAVKKVKGVDKIQEFATSLGILKTEEDFCGLTFFGIGEDFDRTFFEQAVVDGEMPKFSAKKASNQMMLSKRIADKLGVEVGDKIFAYFMGDGKLRARRFLVKGIYETNLSDYDNNYVFTDIYTVRKLNSWTQEMSSGYQMTVKDFDKVEEVTFDLTKKVCVGKENMYKMRFGDEDYNVGVTYGAFSVKQLAAHTFAWLDVLDMNVVIILILMLCVSSFTIVSGLLIIMLERINMIGTLKALGSTNMSIRKIFVNFSVMLVGKGLIIGNVLGLLVCWLQSTFHFVKLDASVYYIDSVPIEYNWIFFIAVNVITLVISSIVIFGSSFLISLSKPVKSMRFE